MAMRRWLCIAALGLSLVAMPVWGSGTAAGVAATRFGWKLLVAFCFSFLRC